MAVLDKDNTPAKPGITGFTLILFSLFLVLIWGSAFTMVGAAVRTLSPDWLVAYRMIIGAAVVYSCTVSYTHLTLPTNREV